MWVGTFHSIGVEILRRHAVRYTLEWYVSGEPFYTPPGRLSTAVAAAVAEVTGTPPQLSTGGGTSDGRFIAPLGADHVLIVDVPTARQRSRRPHRWRELRARERRRVALRVALPRRAPRLEVRQLDVEHGGLQLIDTEVAADEGVVVLRLAAMHAQDFHALGERCVCRDAHAGIAECAQVLGGKERQAADLAEAAGAAAAGVRGTDRLRRILDHTTYVMVMRYVHLDKGDLGRDFDERSPF